MKRPDILAVKPRHKAPVQAYFALALITGLFITGIACAVLAGVVQQKSSGSAPPSSLVPTVRPTVFTYKARQPVTGAYITTTGTPTARADGWATNPSDKEKGIWYAHGPDTASLTITADEPATQIIWVLPDGSQRVQEGDLTYYDPETAGERK